LAIKSRKIADEPVAAKSHRRYQPPTNLRSSQNLPIDKDKKKQLAFILFLSV
jgi:hypothetical protein